MHPDTTELSAALPAPLLCCNRTIPVPAHAAPNHHSQHRVSTRRVSGSPASAARAQVFVDMWRDRKSCMGIVDGKGDLVGNLSISDLRLLNDGNLDLLGKPVGAFLLAARGFAVPEVRTNSTSPFPPTRRCALRRS